MAEFLQRFIAGGVFGKGGRYGQVDYGDMLNTLNGFQYRLDNYKDGIPKLPSINYNFIANTAVNAIGSKVYSQNDYLIGINIGRFHISNDLFLRMIASRNLLPAIGDSSKENVTCKLFNPQTVDIDQLFLLKYNDPESFMPVDSQRAYFAANFAKTALNFVQRDQIQTICGLHYNKQFHVDYFTLTQVFLINTQQ